MTGWIILSVYCAGYVFTARKVPAILIGLMLEGTSLTVDAADRLVGRALGCVVALIWPVILFGALITGKLPKTDREIREEAAAREQRIAALERENERLQTAQERGSQGL